MPDPPPLDRLAALAQRVAARAHVPFSARPEGAVLLLADGAWVPGVRVESASYPLTIPALQGAWAAALGAGRADIVALALSRPLLASEAGWLTDALGVPVRAQLAVQALAAELPPPTDALDLRWPAPRAVAEGIAAAREVARRAHAPVSDFPVGCLLETEDDRGRSLWVPGTNVEHPDWTRGLCAERAALATALALGARTIRRAFLSCPKDPAGTPCGACRQVLAEHLPHATLWMDRGSGEPESTTPLTLLPDNFSADALRP